ncbi:MAG: hypothetical protein LBM98_12055 [Oscillospiraceae bacterium]|nr:hypothetical protein [Oscillospiraceae bacterium]
MEGLDEGCALRGKPPRRLRAAPLHRGEKDGGLEVWLRGYNPRNIRPNPYPLCGGVPPQGRGGFPAARRGGQGVALPLQKLFNCAILKPLGGVFYV